jgi:hypothetical protein
LFLAALSAVGSNVGGTLLLLVSAAVVFALAVFLRRVGARDPKGALTFVVGPDALEFERHAKTVDRVARSEVGVVIVEEFGRAGVLAISVLGPSAAPVGRWETGWLGESPRRAWRALKRHGWPSVLRDQGTQRWVSDDAPSWVRAN